MKAQVKTKCDAEKKKKPQLAKLIITVRCSIYQIVISLRVSSAGALPLNSAPNTVPSIIFEKYNLCGVLFALVLSVRWMIFELFAI